MPVTVDLKMKLPLSAPMGIGRVAKGLEKDVHENFSHFLQIHLREGKPIKLTLADYEAGASIEVAALQEKMTNHIEAMVPGVGFQLKIKTESLPITLNDDAQINVEITHVAARVAEQPQHAILDWARRIAPAGDRATEIVAGSYLRSTPVETDSDIQNWIQQLCKQQDLGHVLAALTNKTNLSIVLSDPGFSIENLDRQIIGFLKAYGFDFKSEPAGKVGENSFTKYSREKVSIFYMDAHITEATQKRLKESCNYRFCFDEPKLLGTPIADRAIFESLNLAQIKAQFEKKEGAELRQIQPVVFSDTSRQLLEVRSEKEADSQRAADSSPVEPPNPSAASQVQSPRP